MTTLYVTERTWKRLNALRKPGDSLGVIIERLLDYYEHTESEKGVQHLSDEEFAELLDELHIDDGELSGYLEMTRKSFMRESK